MARGSWFRRTERNGNGAVPVPEGLWNKCPKCGEISFARDVERNLNVCPKCDHHHRLPARQRIELTADPDSFREFDEKMKSLDPLEFPNYAAKYAADSAKTGLPDAIVTGYAKIEEKPLILGVADFAFMGGSMGSVVGEKIVRAMERGIAERLPVLLFTASGGARMQENLLALMQMAKTSAAAARLEQAAIPYITVLTDPTTGGVYASYASLGDVVLAEPGALIGFAGRRVGNQDMGMKLPDDFQTAEFQQRAGMIDRIVPRKEMRTTLSKMLTFFEEGAVDALQPA